jgi:hypothetical protein
MYSMFLTSLRHNSWQAANVGQAHASDVVVQSALHQPNTSKGNICLL